VGAAGHFGSRGMAGALGPGLPAAMLVTSAWQEPWARGCHRPDGSQGMAEAMVLRLLGRHVGARGMAGAVGPGLRDGNVGSQGMAGSVVPGFAPAMLVPGPWWKLCAPGQRASHVGFRGIAGVVGPGLHRP